MEFDTSIIWMRVSEATLKFDGHVHKTGGIRALDSFLLYIILYTWIFFFFLNKDTPISPLLYLSVVYTYKFCLYCIVNILLLDVFCKLILSCTYLSEYSYVMKILICLFVFSRIIIIAIYLHKLKQSEKTFKLYNPSCKTDKWIIKHYLFYFFTNIKTYWT